MQIIDVNAGMGFWPIQRFTDRSLAELDTTYDRLAIGEVWLSAIESILFPEPDTYDRRLFGQVVSHPRFRPVKTINPLLANWQKSLRETHRQFPLAAIKLFPNYHGYSLRLPVVSELCGVAGELKLPILVQMRVNDERNQPTCLQVRGVDAQEVIDLSLRYPQNLLIALCPYNNEVNLLAGGSSNLLADISFIDDCNSIGQFAGTFPDDRFVFGSHAPFLHSQSALMKVTHFEISEPMRQAVARNNLSSRL